jgi:ABC-2 type transport system permease protein
MACSSFALVRIDGIRGLYYLTMLLMGGQFVPVDVLPGALADLARILPFYWLLGFPVEVLAGRITGVDIAWGMLVLAAWAGGAFVVLRGAWAIGVRRYGAVGA